MQYNNGYSQPGMSSYGNQPAAGGTQWATLGPEFQKREKNKKILILTAIILGCVLLLWALAAAVYFLAFKPASEFELSLGIYAQVDLSGNATLPLGKGKSLKITGNDVDEAFITQDGKHVIVLCKDGRLYITDSRLKKEETLTNNGYYIASCNNRGFTYVDKSYSAYRYEFQNKSSVWLCDDCENLSMADSSAAVAFCDSQGNIYSMPEKTETSMKLHSGAHSADVIFSYVSADGGTVVWNERYSGGICVYLASAGQTRLLLDTDNTYANAVCGVSADEKLLLITVPYSNCSKVWSVKDGKTYEEYELGSEVMSFDFYCDNGPVDQCKVRDCKHIYLSADGNNGQNIICLGEGGRLEKPVRDVSDYAISNKYIAYIDSGKTLYCGRLKDGKIENPTQLARGVYDMVFFGDYIYYITDPKQENEYDDYFNCTMWCYKTGSKEPCRVDDNVSVGGYSYGDYLNAWIYLRLAEDGSILFPKNAFDDDDSWCCCDLYSWSYKDKSVRSIYKLVYLGSLRSGANYVLDSDDFYFNSYNEYCSEGILTDYMHYNGKSAETVANDVVF